MVMNKGLSYTLEAIIAVFIVVVSMIVVFGGLPVPQRPGLTFAEENAFSCVRGLDAEGRLRADAVAKNATNVTNNLRGCIRGSFNYTVQICKDTCTSLALERETDVVSTRYYVAGSTNADPAVVIVYLWAVL